MSLCIECKEVTTITGTICPHCEKEYCPSCLDLHVLDKALEDPEFDEAIEQHIAHESEAVEEFDKYK